MTNEIAIISGVNCYERDGTAYLKLEDVARGLGFTQEKNGVEYVKWERVNQYISDLGFSPEVGKDAFIPENIFYRLAMKAKNEVAEAFQAKVADEIIPSIRRTGGYVSNSDLFINTYMPFADDDTKSLFKQTLLTLEQTNLARKEAERRALEAETKNNILMHVNKTYTMTEIAKELNMKSAKQLNQILANLKVQYNCNDTWVFYSQYSDKGYEEIKQEVLDNGKVIYHRKITQMGRDFILNLLSKPKANKMIGGVNI